MKIRTAATGSLLLIVPVWFLSVVACGKDDAQAKATGEPSGAPQAAGRQSVPNAGRQSGPNSGAASVQFTSWAEPKEHSMTVEVPAGWRTEGELQWRGDLDARQQVTVTSPDGKLRVFFGDLEAMARQVPSQVTFMQTGAREGQT